MAFLGLRGLSVIIPLVIIASALTEAAATPLCDVDGQSQSLTLIWVPYPRFVEVKSSSVGKTVKTLDDLDGFNANLFAEFCNSQWTKNYVYTKVEQCYHSPRY